MKKKNERKALKKHTLEKFRCFAIPFGNLNRFLTSYQATMVSSHLQKSQALLYKLASFEDLQPSVLNANSSFAAPFQKAQSPRPNSLLLLRHLEILKSLQKC